MKSYSATTQILTTLDNYGETLETNQCLSLLKKFFDMLNTHNTDNVFLTNACLCPSQKYLISYFDKYKNQNQVVELDCSDILDNIDKNTYILSMFDEKYIYIAIFYFKQQIDLHEEKLQYKQLIEIAEINGLIQTWTYCKMWYAPES